MNNIEAKISQSLPSLSQVFYHNQLPRYVEELKQHLPVDVYGQCGSLKCPRSAPDHCSSLLKNKYKFYLAFENSLCKDYVTEKFFANAKLRYVSDFYINVNHPTLHCTG